ncbi:MAG: hypothetical protein V7L29_23300 [Nostoc sp.]|uniref:hypothetical protein n=1 Tax=Nostoc sp. TaxID=1180 RepID=UPI002FF5AF61
MKDSDRLYEVALDLASKKCGHPISREYLIVHTKIRAVHGGGVSARIQWFLCSQEHSPTVSFSIRKLEMRTAWERVRQLQVMIIELDAENGRVVLENCGRSDIVK